AFIRTRGGCSYPDSAPVGAPPSVRTGASTFSHPGRVLLPRFHSCRSTALGANRSQHIFAPGEGAPTTASFLYEHRPRCESEPAHIRTRGGCSYPDSAPVGAPPSVRTGRAHFRTQRVLLPRPGSCRSTALGANRGSTYSHPGRVLLQRSPHPLHSAGDDAADATHHQPANMGGVGDSTETQYADD